MYLFNFQKGCNFSAVLMLDYMNLCLANPTSKDLKMLVFCQQLRPGSSST